MHHFAQPTGKPRSECRKLALRVPDDISIAGHDDLDFAAILDPALTTRISAVSGNGADAALEHGEPLKSLSLDASLLARGSTARPRRT
jgi:DNA-binding LacI/PurR family transcriptional regulator